MDARTGKMLSRSGTALSVSLILFLLWPVNHWWTRPTASGKWQSCLAEKEPRIAVWMGKVSYGCGSPETYDGAEWWTRTRGGKDVQ